jgi:hypothetical protein
VVVYEDANNPQFIGLLRELAMMYARVRGSRGEE